MKCTELRLNFPVGQFMTVINRSENACFICPSVTLVFLVYKGVLYV